MSAANIAIPAVVLVVLVLVVVLVLLLVVLPLVLLVVVRKTKVRPQRALDAAVIELETGLRAA
jgi:flagellar biosynthesis/type III secretory pathway M-ring protein FliF/YscJ